MTSQVLGSASGQCAVDESRSWLTRNFEWTENVQLGPSTTTASLGQATVQVCILFIRSASQQASAGCVSHHVVVIYRHKPNGDDAFTSGTLQQRGLSCYVTPNLIEFV